MRSTRISNELEHLRTLPFLNVIECQHNGISAQDYWVLWLPASNHPLWKDAIFPVQIRFPPDYPKAAPSIRFEPDFKHIHVYDNGRICMPILQAQYWKPKMSMGDLVQRVINLIHQQINAYSPANSQLFRIYKEEPQKYKQIISQQRIRHLKKDIKYFKQPCMHVQVSMQSSDD